MMGGEHGQDRTGDGGHEGAGRQPRNSRTCRKALETTASLQVLLQAGAGRVFGRRRLVRFEVQEQRERGAERYARGGGCAKLPKPAA